MHSSHRGLCKLTTIPVLTSEESRIFSKKKPLFSQYLAEETGQKMLVNTGTAKRLVEKGPQWAPLRIPLYLSHKLRQNNELSHHDVTHWFVDSCFDAASLAFWLPPSCFFVCWARPDHIWVRGWCCGGARVGSDSTVVTPRRQPVTQSSHVLNHA